MQPLQSILIVTLLAVGGCEAHRPSFVSRVREDCAAGDRWACELLDSLGHPKPSPAVGSPHASRDATPSWRLQRVQLQMYGWCRDDLV